MIKKFLSFFTIFEAKKDCKYEKFISWFVVMFVTVFFCVLLIDKFFPITEGWFQDYARYINRGEFIYRDFYCPVPPGYIWITSFICKLTNYSFLALRVFGIIERLALSTIIYVIVSKIYNYKVVAFSLIIASVIYASTNTDIFYGYYQSALLFSVLTLYFCVRMYETYNNEKNIYSVLYGVSAGLTFCMKQNTGALFAVFIGLGYIFLTRKQNIKKSITNIAIAFGSAMAVISLMLIYLAANGALMPFFEQVIGGTSAKGNIISIFTAFIPRMINADSMKLFLLCICILICINIGKQKFKDDADINTLSLKKSMYILIWAIIGLAFYQYFIKPFYLLDILNAMVRAKYFFAFVLGCFAIIFCILLNKNYTLKKINLNYLYYIGLVIAMCSILLYINITKNEFADYQLIRTNRASLIYALFFYNIFFVLYLIFLQEKTQNLITGTKIILFIASFSLMYIHGMSYIVEDHGTLILFTLIIAELLSVKVIYNKLKNLSVWVICMFMFATIAVQRNNFTYNWWGVNTLPDSYSAEYEYKDPKLEGMKGNLQQTTVLNEIYEVIERYKTDGDTMYTFPHINYFNVMSDLDSPAFAKVHYFDVCSDTRAEEDASILNKEKPSFIIWQDFTESEWATHEAIFRNGNLCGQRALQEWYWENTSNGKYKLLGCYNLPDADPIYVWIINDGSHLKKNEKVSSHN